MDIRFLGHAASSSARAHARVLVDPFLKPNNPTAPVTADEVEPTHILLTHGHADHIADAVAVAKRTGRPLRGDRRARELARRARRRRRPTTRTSAAPSSSTGAGSSSSRPSTRTRRRAARRAMSRSAPRPGPRSALPAGLVINIGGTTVYHLGDTCLFGDMKLIAERTPVDVALVPIGGHYTMDRHDAVDACGLLGAGTVIPMHYDTFPPIETDAGRSSRRSRAAPTRRSWCSSPAAPTPSEAADAVAGAAPSGTAPCNRSVPVHRGASPSPMASDRANRAPAEPIRTVFDRIDPGQRVSRRRGQGAVRPAGVRSSRHGHPHRHLGAGP